MRKMTRFGLLAAMLFAAPVFSAATHAASVAHSPAVKASQNDSGERHFTLAYIKTDQTGLLAINPSYWNNAKPVSYDNLSAGEVTALSGAGLALQGDLLLHGRKAENFTIKEESGFISGSSDNDKSLSNHTQMRSVTLLDGYVALSKDDSVDLSFTGKADFIPDDGKGFYNLTGFYGCNNVALIKGHDHAGTNAPAMLVAR